MADKLYISSTPKEVSEAKGLHLITQNTPNGQAVQLMLEELALAYGTQFTYSVINIGTNIQKDEWFLRLDPNGRIPVLIDNNQSPPFPSHETSAEILYLLKFADKEDKFGFKDVSSLQSRTYSGHFPYPPQFCSIVGGSSVQIGRENRSIENDPIHSLGKLVTVAFQSNCFLTAVSDEILPG